MKVSFFLLKIILISQVVFAQLDSKENLYPIQNKANRTVYIDKTGKQIFELDSLESTFTTNKEFINGSLYLVYPGMSLTKLFNKKGKSETFVNGYLRSSMFFPMFKYGYATFFDQGYKTGGGIIDSTGKIVLPINRKYQDLVECGERMFAYRVEKEVEFIDPFGKLLFTMPLDACEGRTFSFLFNNGLSIFSKGAKLSNNSFGDNYFYSLGKKGFMNKNGVEVIAPIYSMADPFYEGYALVKLNERDEKYFFITKSGTKAFDKEFGYTSLGPRGPRFSEGLANVADPITKKAGYIDTTGNWAIKPIYISTSNFHSGLGMGLTEDNVYHFLNNKGEVLFKGNWGKDIHGQIWWDEHVIYVEQIGTYFNHKGQKIYAKNYPFMYVNSLQALQFAENPELIKSIYLSNGISEIPKKIFQCKNLEKLIINDYESTLSSLPIELYNLKKLKELELNFKNVKSLNPGIGKLQNLESFKLKNTQITRLPPDFVNLKNLKKVDLSTNMLITLPSGFEKLKNVTDVNTDFNPITNLPLGFYKLPKLSRFSFKRNTFIENKVVIERLSKAYPEASLTTREATLPENTK
ncbi:MAG: WG repeat-containing protein, partial [Leadbetterella sp.]